ncbi:MAG: tRNA (guanosine(46)-N7)-methyltransferase TrmB [Bacilli bacterium]|nr:tRNA (guanosine(46)-N7)-methyltransferase TrmB [Bacilli bacterium]
MRLRNLKNKDEIISNCNYLIKDIDNLDVCTLFDNDNPIHLEIGMGKGQFLIKMAMKYPNINFIGIEKYENVLARAINKINDYEINNIRVINMDAIDVSKIFNHNISCLYLNFSDPWPKTRHSERRLTSGTYLKSYENIFVDKKIIRQKTDNVGLFESSIVNLNQAGYKITEISLDLANSEIDNETTEYEDKFSSKGIKINYLKAEKE